MIHASVELTDAMAGSAPTLSELPRPVSVAWRNAVSACTLTVAGERIVWGYARGNSEDPWGPVDCPTCLALMAEARGLERTAELLVYADHLDERGETVRANAIRTAVLFTPGSAPAARRKTA